VLPLDSQSNVSSHQPVPLPPPSAPRGRNPMIIMIVILLCLTAGAIAGIALLLRPDSGTATAGSAESSVESAASPDAGGIPDADRGEGGLPGAANYRWRR
jgi:hypothetical protein